MYEYERFRPLFNTIEGIEAIKTALQRNSRTPIVVQYKKQLAQAIEKRDELFYTFQQHLEQWTFNVGSMYLQLKRCSIQFELETIKQKLYRYTATRILEYSSLRSQVQAKGYKATKKIH